MRRFPDWAFGLRRARILDAAETTEIREVRPGTTLGFTLSAAGLTHEVTSIVTTVEAPRRLEWRYADGAVGVGGWVLEDAGPGTVRMTLSTDYQVEPVWLNRLAHRPFFRRLTEDLLRRSMRRFGQRLEEHRDG